MNLLSLDFETYFANDYTLSKMTTEAYVRDPRFKVHMVGVSKMGYKEAERPPNIYRGDNGYIAHDLYWGDTAFVCHHAHFDGLILSHHYGVKPKFWFDTLSMARIVFPHAKSHSLGALAKMLGLKEKTVPYESFKNIRDLSVELHNRVAEGCINDVELTYEIFKAMLPFVPQSELRLIDLTVRMFTEPALRLDRAKLAQYLEETKEQKNNVLEELGVTKEDLGSAKKFAAILESLGVEPPKKISKTTGEETFAFAKTDSGLKDLLEYENDRVASLVSARLGTKSNILETRGQRLLDMDSRGNMAVYLKYYGAHTGRWSGGDKMNWQNFKRGSVLRESIIAPDGYVLCVIDLAQIECRVLNWLAGQEDVLDAFKTGRDLYSEGASRFYGRQISKADKVERHLGKTLELGCGYGMGAEKFRITCKAGVLGGPSIELSEDNAWAAVQSYRDSHPKVKELWKKADDILGYLLTGALGIFWGPMQVNNKRIFYPGGSWSDYTTLAYNGKDYYLTSRRGITKIYGAKLVENVVQALSRVILGEMMLKIAERYKIVTTTHDEIVYLAKFEEASAALDFGLQTMKTPPAWCRDIPLDAEGGFARNYSK